MKTENILRGKLLDLLRKVYPEGIDQKTIISILFQYHKSDDILSSLEYLTDKKYIIKKEQPHPFLKHEKIQWYKLTPCGIDLLDGNINDDPGILLQRG
ncbi:MAG: hypothetical protein FWD47_12855 [Treponema sp.]|nr:hypothetical protein [Treponema sp.]